MNNKNRDTINLEQVAKTLLLAAFKQISFSRRKNRPGTRGVAGSERTASWSGIKCTDGVISVAMQQFDRYFLIMSAPRSHVDVVRGSSSYLLQCAASRREV